MANELLSVRLPVGSFTLQEVDEKANKIGLSRSEFVIKAVDMLMNFDDVFLEKIKMYSEGLNIPEWLVMQNFIIDMMAQDAAKMNVWGPSQDILMMFPMLNDGDGYRMVTGGELHEMLTKMYEGDEEKKKVEVLLEGEKYGDPMDESDKKLLIKYRKGKVWEESEEHKRGIEMKRIIKEAEAKEENKTTATFHWEDPKGE